MMISAKHTLRRTCVLHNPCVFTSKHVFCWVWLVFYLVFVECQTVFYLGCVWAPKCFFVPAVSDTEMFFYSRVGFRCFLWALAGACRGPPTPPSPITIAKSCVAWRCRGRLLGCGELYKKPVAIKLQVNKRHKHQNKKKSIAVQIKNLNACDIWDVWQITCRCDDK